MALTSLVLCWNRRRLPRRALRATTPTRALRLYMTGRGRGWRISLAIRALPGEQDGQVDALANAVPGDTILSRSCSAGMNGVANLLGGRRDLRQRAAGTRACAAPLTTIHLFVGTAWRIPPATFLGDDTPPGTSGLLPYPIYLLCRPA